MWKCVYLEMGEYMGCGNSFKNHRLTIDINALPFIINLNPVIDKNNYLDTEK